MKRIFYLMAILILVLSLGAFIACGDDDDDDNDDEADDDDDDDDDNDTGDDDTGDDDTGDDDDTVGAFGEVVGWVEIDYAEDLVCDGNYCYVAGKEQGFHTVDVSDVTAPEIVDTVDTAGVAWDFALVDGALYVADKSGGVHKYDLTDPAAPEWVWTYTSLDLTMVESVDVIGDMVYIGGGNGNDGFLETLQMAAKSDVPTRTGLLSITGEAIVSLACMTGFCFGGGGDGTLFKIAVDEKADPTVEDSYFNAGTAGHEPWGLGVTIHDDTVYFSDWGAGLIALETDLTEVAVVQTGDGVYDSAYAGAKTIMGTAYTDVFAAANSQGGLALFDASAGLMLIGDPLDVVPPGEMADGPHGVVVMGNYAYLADNMAQGLSIVRIND
ncbi:MAG TPA: hypothetical protein PKW95_21075 [bacterium]|nr:hypothetical protein [bacterium]